MQKDYVAVVAHDVSCNNELLYSAKCEVMPL
jgi:hypothetical protein